MSSSRWGGAPPAEGMVVAVLVFAGALWVGPLRDLAGLGSPHNPGQLGQLAVHQPGVPGDPLRRQGPSIPVHHGEDAPLRVGDQLHLMHPPAVHADLEYVVGVGRRYTLPFDLPALLDAHGLALQGNPVVPGEFRMAADAVRVFPHHHAGVGHRDLQLQLTAVGEDGMAGLPAAAVHPPDDQDLGHVAHGHAVQGMLIRRVGLLQVHGGVGEGAGTPAGAGHSEVGRLLPVEVLGRQGLPVLSVGQKGPPACRRSGAPPTVS